MIRLLSGIFLPQARNFVHPPYARQPPALPAHAGGGLASGTRYRKAGDADQRRGLDLLSPAALYELGDVRTQKRGALRPACAGDSWRERSAPVGGAGGGGGSGTGQDQRLAALRAGAGALRRIAGPARAARRVGSVSARAALADRCNARNGDGGRAGESSTGSRNQIGIAGTAERFGARVSTDSRPRGRAVGTNQSPD